MTCECPVEVYADVDTLPAPALYSVRKLSGASLNDEGDWLYGLVRKTSGGTVHKLVRWPYPALNTYEELVDAGSTLIAYPRVVGDDLYYLEPNNQRIKVTDAETGGAGTTVGTFDIDTPGFSFSTWGLGWAAGKLWVAYLAADEGGSNPDTRTGIVEMTTGGAWSTHEFSNAPDDGTNPLLFDGLDIVVATDDAVWVRVDDNTSNGIEGLARFDTGSETWDFTPSSENWIGLSPLQDGTVRSREQNLSGASEFRIVAPDLTHTADPCADGTTADTDLEANAMMAWNADYTLIVYKNGVTVAEDKLLAVECAVAGGWFVGSVSMAAGGWSVG